uniref:Uncharacterized protein n=1 Tax=Panagrolaimus superbus TaxID=310955 RepID=A0A914ZAV6_9BILA
MADFETFDGTKSQKGLNSWKKFSKHLSSNFLINDYGLSKEKEERSSAKSSTLSLHIAAYENSMEVSNHSNSNFNSNFSENKNEGLKKNGLVKSWKIPRQNFSSSIIQNPFEFPRQQENEETKTPEIAQFKASQKLLKVSNKTSIGQHGIITHIVQQSDNQIPPPHGYGASNDNVFGSERALLERFKIPNMETLSLENRGSDFRTKKFIIELLHLHWYHETNRIVVTESRVANGYKLANELIAQNDLKEQQFLQVSNRGF